MTTPIKDDFKVVDMPKLDYKGKVRCTRCGKDFTADQLVYARPLKGPYSKHLRWYCPTWNCHGFLNSGVYYLTVSS